MPIRPANIFGRKTKLFTPRSNEYFFGSNNGKIGLSSNEMLFERTGSYPSSSFHADPIGYPLRSTQQIPIDYSQFENHTFFNSAEANVNMAFNTIINEFPFDGSRNEMREFLDSLTGFEKYVYDSIPKSKGYLKFDSSNQSYISIVDRKGSFAPELASNPDGTPVIDPRNKPITFEFDLFFPSSVATDNCTVFQKYNSTNNGGFSAFLSGTSALDETVTLQAYISSGSQVMSASAQIERGKFEHCAVIFNRKPSVNRIQIVTGSELVATSSNSIEMGLLGFPRENLIIGSGSTHYFVPQQTLTGALDDFRVFHSVRNVSDIGSLSSVSGTVYPEENPDLVALYRFNEPTGSFSGNSVVLDSSGNGLHSQVTNFVSSSRIQDIAPAFTKSEEDTALSPVLFPTYPDLATLNTRLLSSASNYDANNPSLITKLVPRHLLDEATQFEGFDDIEADIGDPYTTDNLNKPIPGSGKIGSPQIVSAFLFTFAKQFDEYKIYLDHFSKLLTVNYDNEDDVADQLIEFFSENSGIQGAPFVYRLLSAAQYYNGQNVVDTAGYSPISIKQVAARMLKRVLLNYQDILRSKGTRHAIESVFRAIGINPDTSIRIREFGGSYRTNLATEYRKMAEVRSKLDLSGSLLPGTPTLDAQGFSNTNPYVISTYLSQSRTEPGFPNIAGTFVGGVSNSPNDGLLTSGSFTVESLVQFPGLLTGSYASNQSIFRLHTTGTNQSVPLANVLAVSESLSQGITGSLHFFARSIDDATVSNTAHLVLTGVNVFDGDSWYVSAGRTVGTKEQPFTTASYFLRAGNNYFGSRLEAFQTSKIFQLSDGSNTDLFSNITAANNSSGSFIVVGSQSLGNITGNAGLANSTAVTASLARETNFQGNISELRFYSKKLEDREFFDHVRNVRSLGVIDPLVNYNFVTARSGSFEKLRLDLSMDQIVTESNALGSINLVDFSQNFDLGGTANSFEASTRIIKPARRDFNLINPRFDERSKENKIRIRSYQNATTAEEENVSVAPLHELVQSELPQDDNRFSVEISLAKALNEDIVNIISTLESIEIAIGKTESLYSLSYKDLDNLRDVYFNRLTDKVNFQQFFEIYNWFDTTIGQFISQLLPSRTDFFGTNFVVESHILERQKIAYKDYKQYLRATERDSAVEEDLDSNRYVVDDITGRVIG